MIAGLAGALTHGLTAQGVPAADAARVAALPPVGVLFASLLGYNPVQTLLGPHALAQLPAGHADYLTGRAFFPALISPPFSDGLSVAFDFAIAACLVAAFASLLRGERYIHGDRHLAATRAAAEQRPDASASPAPAPLTSPEPSARSSPQPYARPSPAPPPPPPEGPR